MLRKVVQIITAIITNGYYKGFIKGNIFKGESKYFCVPGLNCYSCPGALGACPIGAFQAVVNSAGYFFSFYVTGFLLIIGTLLGRFVCGWLCPFGLIQEWMYKIPTRKIKISRRLYFLKHAKFIFLFIFVIGIPIFVSNAWGIGYPAYCKYICPAGTLEAGVPLLISNPSLRTAAGALFVWKAAILIVVLFVCAKIYRFFCKFMCPLGAVYALFNKISYYRLNIDAGKCIQCQKCVKVCKMDVIPFKKSDSFECIRCGDCKNICPTNAISMGIKKV